MMSDIPFVKASMRVDLHGAGSVANTMLVQWSEISGGDVDAGTGALVGGTETFLSGAVRALSHSVPARNVVVKFAEIQTGDLILDLESDPKVTLYPGQSVSGAVSLDSLADKGLRFFLGGRWYSSKQLSPDLQHEWDCTVGDVQLYRTLLLRKET